jgi:glycosyltransferase involved in cell wall biosynthesis
VLDKVVLEGLTYTEAAAKLGIAEGPLKSRLVAAKRALRELGDLPNVEVLPPTPDMRAIYGRARVLLFPAQWEEAFGRTVLEALLCGVPVLATAVGGILETGLSRGGVVLPRGADPELWSRALLKLDDPAVYAAASEGAREDSAWYNLDEQVDKLEAVLAECLRRKGAATGTGNA